MKKLLQAFRREFAWAGRSAGSVAVLLVCLVLPALYVLFVLSAAWDPFANAAAVKVAVVCEDAGYTASGREWNLGGELVQLLEADDAAGWVRMEKAEAIAGVNAGTCYAALVIPEDFSAEALGKSSDNDTQPRIEYYINEKRNVLAPKSMEGLGLVQQRIAGALSRALSGRLHLPAGTEAPSEDGIAAALKQADAELELCETAVQALLGTEEPAATVTASGGEEPAAAGEVGAALAAAKQAASDALRAVQNARQSEDAAQELELARRSCEAAASYYRQGRTLLEGLNNRLPQPIRNADGVFDLLEEGAAGQDGIAERLSQALSSLEDGQLSPDTARGLVAAADEARGDSNYIERYYQGNVVPQLEGIAADAARTADRYSGGAAGKAAPASDGTDLAELSERLHEARTQLRVVLEGVEAFGMVRFDSLSGGAEIDYQTLYSIENYGSAAAPFYTAVALWMGCLLLAARKKREMRENAVEIKPSHGYWGGTLFFLLMTLIQATAVCLTELWALGVQCRSPLLFLASGWMSALAYGSIVYGLTEAFEGGGKAAGVLLLAVQAACAGAAFPVETASAFFQWVNAFLPFTYGAGAMRETIAGLYRSDYLQNLLFLLAYAPVFLAVGILVRKGRSGSAGKKKVSQEGLPSR